jgi:hypothetical protein
MLKIVIFLVFCCFAGPVFSQTPMQLLASIESPFVSDTNSWGGNIKGNGDINGDGFNDIVLVGAPIGASQYQRDVYIYLGGLSINNQPDFIITDPAYPGPYYSFGTTATYSNDINGDGYCDLVITQLEDGEDVYWGRVLAFYGGPAFDVIPDIIWNGNDYGLIPYGLQFGYNLDTSGDFNGDGYNDLVISSKHGTLFYSGRVSIFYGGPDIDTICDWSFQGEYGDGFGISLAVGDINGDGYSDLAAFSSYQFETDTTTIQLFLGGIVFDTTPDYAYEVVMGYYIIPMLMDRDMNGDTYDDLLYHLGSAVFVLWGSTTLGNYFVGLHNTPATNLRSIYYADFDGTTYLCYGIPQLENFMFYRWDPQQGCILDYNINENYNPNASNQVSYFLGDINGDGHSEILLSNRTNNPILFKVFSNEYDSALDENFISKPVMRPEVYPNPFTLNTTVTYELRKPCKTEISVYNIKGQFVTMLEDSHMGAGKHSTIWNGKEIAGNDVPSGVYLIQIKIDGKPIGHQKVTIIE